MHKILTDPFFYGEHAWSGQLWKGNYEPIITQQLFNKVQVLLAERCSYSRPAIEEVVCLQAVPEELNIVDAASLAKNSKEVIIAVTFIIVAVLGREPTILIGTGINLGCDNCIQKRWTETEVDHLIA